jgi:hypothetical protein
MMEADAALSRAHRDNIRRYNKLLETHLTDIERDFIESRLSEEWAVLQSLQSGASGTRGYSGVSRSPTF